MVDPPDHPLSNSSSQSRSSSKRSLQDITDTAGNGVPPKRRRGRPVGSKDGQLAPSINPALYNPTPPEPLFYPPVKKIDDLRVSRVVFLPPLNLSLKMTTMTTYPMTHPPDGHTQV